MERGGTVLLDGVEVFGSRIAFVAVPAVVGILLVEAAHDFVAVGFCEDAGSSHGHVTGIALDDALVGDVGLVVEAVAVDDEELGLDSQLLTGKDAASRTAPNASRSVSPSYICSAVRA